MNMSSRFSASILFAAALAILSFAASNAMAEDGSGETKWEKKHPRRAQVNHRLARQEARITKERKEGELSKEEAHELRKEDHQVRQEERAMASQNNGHITRTEQKALNQQENTISKKIGS